MSRDDGRISPEGRWELWVGGMFLVFILLFATLLIWAAHIGVLRPQAAASVSLPSVRAER